MIRRPPRSTLSSSSAASDVYKRQIHNLAVSSGTLILILILIVVYVLIKTGVMTCCGRTNRNTEQMQQVDREDEQKRVKEEIPSHRVDMLSVHQVAALMNQRGEHGAEDAD